MDDLFEGLNDVPWAELSSAYGNADEIPAWIRRLASKDEDVRAQAIRCLANELEHQFTLYSASATAIPFLVRLLPAREIEGKADILHLLGIIAFAARDFVSFYGAGDIVYAPDGSLAGVTVAQVLEALRSGIPAYVGLLSHAAVEVRMQAADVVSLADVGQEVAAPLRAAYRYETTEVGRANLVLALARQSTVTDEETKFFLDLLRSPTRSVLCAAAGLALGHSIPAEAPEEAIMLLGQLLSSESDTRDILDSLPCLHDCAEAVISSALHHVDPARLRILLPHLRTSILALSYHRAWELFVFLTGVAFGAERWGGEGLRPESSLTQEQRDCLGVVLKRPDLWRAGNIWAALHPLGLPNTPEDLAAYLGVALPPDAVELAAAHRPKPAPRSHPLEQYRQRIMAKYPNLMIYAIGSRDCSRGQNNAAVSVNHTLLFRFPKHTRAIDEMERELRLLRALHGKLPLPIPKPIYSSLEPREVGHAFMGYEKLPGKPLYREMLESVPGEQTVQRLAEQLGGFLRALHTLPVAEVFDFELPTVGTRERWERMYADIREKLFPQMRPDARESVTAHFERALADDAMFAYTPVLIHGDFGASNILYNARTRTISGIIDWSSAGLGDPATDLAALICPASYGEAFAPRLTSVYPGMDDLLARAHFYIGTFALQEALFGAEHDDAGALTRGLADYV